MIKATLSGCIVINVELLILRLTYLPTFSVNTLRVAKPEKGQKIEAMLIQMAQTGQLGGKIGEDELIGLLGMNFQSD